MKKINNKFDVLGPVPIFITIWISAILIPYLINDDDDPFYLYWPYQFKNAELTINASLYIYIAVLVFYILGVWLSRCFSHSINNVKCAVYSISLRKPVLRTFFLVAFTGVLVLLSKFGGLSGVLEGASDRTRVFQGSQYLVLMVGILNSISIAQFIFWIKTEKDKSKNFKLFLATTVFSIFATMISGSKYGIFTLLLALIGIYHYTHQRLKLFRICTITIIMYFFLISYHLIKQEYFAVGHFVSVDTDMFWSSFFKYAYTMWAGNFFALKTMGIIYEEYPSVHDYMFGETFLYLITLMIPSSIYPEKPITVPGIFTLNNWPNKWLEEGTTLPTGVFGEAYMNFGLIGVVLYSMFYGYIIGYFYQKMKRYPFGTTWLIFYTCSVAAMLGYFRGEFAAVTLQFIVLSVPSVLLLRNKLK